MLDLYSWNAIGLLLTTATIICSPTGLTKRQTRPFFNCLPVRPSPRLTNRPGSVKTWRVQCNIVAVCTPAFRQPSLRFPLSQGQTPRQAEWRWRTCRLAQTGSTIPLGGVGPWELLVWF